MSFQPVVFSYPNYPLTTPARHTDAFPRSMPDGYSVPNNSSRVLMTNVQPHMQTNPHMSMNPHMTQMSYSERQGQYSYYPASEVMSRPPVLPFLEDKSTHGALATTGASVAPWGLENQALERAGIPASPMPPKGLATPKSNDEAIQRPPPQKTTPRNTFQDENRFDGISSSSSSIPGDYVSIIHTKQEDVDRLCREVQQRKDEYDSVRSLLTAKETECRRLHLSLGGHQEEIPKLDRQSEMQPVDGHFKDKGNDKTHLQEKVHHKEEELTEVQTKLTESKKQLTEDDSRLQNIHKDVSRVREQEKSVKNLFRSEQVEGGNLRLSGENYKAEMEQAEETHEMITDEKDKKVTILKGKLLRSSGSNLELKNNEENSKLEMLEQSHETLGGAVTDAQEQVKLLKMKLKQKDSETRKLEHETAQMTHRRKDFVEKCRAFEGDIKSLRRDSQNMKTALARAHTNAADGQTDNSVLERKMQEATYEVEACLDDTKNQNSLVKELKHDRDVVDGMLNMTPGDLPSHSNIEAYMRKVVRELLTQNAGLSSRIKMLESACQRDQSIVEHSKHSSMYTGEAFGGNYMKSPAIFHTPMPGRPIQADHLDASITSSPSFRPLQSSFDIAEYTPYE